MNIELGVWCFKNFWEFDFLKLICVIGIVGGGLDVKVMV